MKERFLLFTNLALFILAILVLGTLQTSLWFQVFGYFPAPAMWLPVLIYVALFRSTLETILFSYLTGFVLSTLTVMPEGLLMSVCLALALSVQLFKTRIYWLSASYSMMVCGLAALVFHVFHWAATFLIEDVPLTSPQVSSWLIECLLTPLLAPVVFPILQLIDRLTNRESATEMSSTMS